MTFRLLEQRLQFHALESVHFPQGKAGNILRGALGMLSVPLPRPATPLAGGFTEPPQPFVLRAAHLNGLTLAAGSTFEISLHVFDLHQPIIRQFTAAFAELAHTGLGPRRPRVELQPVQPASLIELDLSPGPSVSAIRIHFRTPTELKGWHATPELPFGILFARVRDRISTLSALYGAGAPHINYKAFGDRAAAIRTVRCELRHNDVLRTSSRTGQTHGIGGFTGFADYGSAGGNTGGNTGGDTGGNTDGSDDLGEFLPWLRAAAFTGVGRHTVWGNGVIDCVIR